MKTASQQRRFPSYNGIFVTCLLAVTEQLEGRQVKFGSRPQRAFVQDDRGDSSMHGTLELEEACLCGTSWRRGGGIAQKAGAGQIEPPEAHPR